MHPSLPDVSPPRISRPLKAFALLVVASLGTAVFAEKRTDTGDAPSGEANFITLTDTGGDRATAYAMSNKIVRQDGKYYVTWIDSQRTNHWAAVDEKTGRIVDEGTVGEERQDNHSGAALVKAPDGTLHLMLGGHFSKLSHYQLPPGETIWALVEDGAEIARTGPGKAPTYPSLTCDDHGTLHLAYRSEPGGHDAALCYCRRPQDGEWSTPITLIKNVVKEHSWMHNAIQVDSEGRLHVLATITLPYARLGEDARYYGAAHIYSDDGGDTWKQLDNDKPLSTPIAADALYRIEGNGMTASRTSPTHRGKGGPWHPYVYRMMLSNISLDEHNNPRIIMGNLMDGTAKLWRHTSDAGWESQELKHHLDSLVEKSDLPPYRIQHLPCVARLPNGHLQVVLMVSPIASTGWGADYTRLARLEFDADLQFQSIEWVAQSNSRDADWIPSLEFYDHRDPYRTPAMLFTRGRNAGGYSNNVNDVETEVLLQLPAVKD
ncbi:BNR-4 repeat-containing protein [Aeoliella sp.]|uniref:BNR-4 repeat-containing protein n=1 Tax=Aeoliella sp. TaxID=2795800 RepID=UPI003CCC28BD